MNERKTLQKILVDRVEYNDKLPWPREADRGGGSLERLVPTAYGNDPANWHVTTVFGGTPGRRNSVAGVAARHVFLARNNPRNSLSPADIEFPYDFNRDGQVNATDVLLARNHQTSFLTALELIDPSGEAVGSQAVSTAASGDQGPAPVETNTDALFENMDWLYEFEQSVIPGRSPEKANRTAEAVDQLLATYWD